MDKTVPEWCKARHLSRSTYHKLKNIGRGPKELEIPGTRIKHITPSTARWLPWPAPNRHGGMVKAPREAPRQAKAPATRTAEITESRARATGLLSFPGGANRQKRRIINVTEQNSPPAAASSKPDTPKGARAVCSIAVDAITVPSERLRKLRPEVVDWLVESITARSLLEPIIVRRRGAGYELIAGHHRFEAARNCGHQTIRAEVYDSLSDDEAELIQIDENLIRANLSDAERILHVARRKELYEKLHPETKHGGDRRSAGARLSFSK